MMKISRLVSRGVQHCKVSRSISSSCPHLAGKSTNDNYDTVVKVPAHKMSLIKNYQKIWNWIIPACCVVNIASSGLWQVLEPSVLGIYTNIAAGASFVVLPGIVTSYYAAKILGQVKVDAGSGKLIVSHLDPFGDRVNKQFNASECHFKMAGVLDICYLPDGKYFVISRHCSSEERELLLSTTANQPGRTDGFGPDKQKVRLYASLVFTATAGVFMLCLVRYVYEEYYGVQTVESEKKIVD